MVKTRREQILALLQEDPNDSFLWYGLAMDYLSAGELEPASKTFAELRQRFPDYVPGYVQAGQLFVKMGLDDDAREAWRSGIAVARKVGDLHAAGEMEGFLASLE